MIPSSALIIPAAGAGKRMKCKTAKPYLQLQGKAILAHTISCFLSVPGLKQVLIATSDAYLERAREILQQTAGDSMPWQVIEGGATRQKSIHHAIKELGNVDLVMVHDAVRPFVTQKLIESCCRQAENFGTAIPGFPCKDTVKKVDDDHFVQETPDRSRLWKVQTPQVFKKELLIKAYDHAEKQNYEGTDDASLVEWLGEPVKIVKGSPDNFKITYPRDLQLAKFQFNNQNKMTE